MKVKIYWTWWSSYGELRSDCPTEYWEAAQYPKFARNALDFEAEGELLWLGVVLHPLGHYAIYTDPELMVEHLLAHNLLPKVIDL